MKDKKKEDNYKINIKKSNAKIEKKWLVKIILWTMIISGTISFLSDTLLSRVDIVVAFIILISIILIGIIFDIVGVASTAGDEMPFHAMASKKVPGAKIAIELIRNADKVSTFCNDVIGDVSGIVSGTIGATILAKAAIYFNGSFKSFISLFFGAFIAAATVGGKAIGKSYAMNNSNKIIYDVARFVYFFKKDR